MGLKLNNSVTRIIVGLLPPTILWALIISLIGAFIMWIVNFAAFYVGFCLTLITYYVLVTIYVFGRQGYWFITKTGDYKKVK